MNAHSWWPVTRPWLEQIYKEAANHQPEPDYSFWLGDLDHREPVMPKLPMGYQKYKPYWPNAEDRG